MGCRIRARSSGAVKRGVPSPGSPGFPADDRGLSNIHATLLMVVITVVLAALLLLMLLAMIPSWSWTEPAQPPIIIIDIVHTSTETGKLTYASRVFLLNNGSTVYENDDLKAIFYQDDQRVRTVQTLNGHLLIKSHHYGVRYLTGQGCRSRYWNPGEVMEVDLHDQTLIPGAKVTVEIVDKQTKEVISKHTVIA